MFVAGCILFSIAMIWTLIVFFGRYNRALLLKDAAQRVGLKLVGEAVTGELLGYPVSARLIPERSHEEHTPARVELTIKLWTPPERLTLARRQAHDNHLLRQKMLDRGGPFDRIYTVRADDEAAATEWISIREEPFEQLDEVVDFVELVDSTLVLMLSAVPTAEELATMLSWAAETAARIDTPIAAGIPPLSLDLGPRTVLYSAEDEEARSVTERTTDVLLAVALLIGGALLLHEPVTAKLFDATTEAIKKQDSRFKYEALGEFLDCVSEREGKMLDDWAPCEAYDPDPAVEQARRALSRMRQTQARYAARAELDATTAQETLVVMMRETSPPTREMLPFFWTFGLVENFVDIVSQSTLKPPANYWRMLALNNTVMRAAMRGAHDGIDPMMVCLHSRTPIVECRYFSLNGPQIAYDFEQHPDRAAAYVDELPWEAALQRYAQQLVTEQELTDDVEQLTQAAPPLSCETPWLAEQAYGEPRLFDAAAARSEQLGDRLSLLAARQWVLLGKFEEARASIARLSDANEMEQVCAAQLESAMGDPAAALRRLDRLPASATSLLAAAQAHFLLGEWSKALANAQRASGQHAAMIVMAAAAQLGIPDGMEPSSDEGEAVKATRTVTRLRLAHGQSPTARWEAPDEVPLLRGSEAPQLVALGTLAPEKVEYWLDQLLPERFDPYGYAIGRRIAAELRGDEDAAIHWRAIEQRHNDMLTSLQKAQIYRDSRRL